MILLTEQTWPSPNKQKLVLYFLNISKLVCWRIGHPVLSKLAFVTFQELKFQKCIFGPMGLKPKCFSEIVYLSSWRVKKGSGTPCKITLPSFCICTFANSVQVLPSKRDTMPDVNWEYESSSSVSPEQPPRLFWEIEIMWWEWRVESPPLFTVWNFWEFFYLRFYVKSFFFAK